MWQKYDRILQFFKQTFRYAREFILGAIVFKACESSEKIWRLGGNGKAARCLWKKINCSILRFKKNKILELYS